MRVVHVADFSAPYAGAFIRQLRMLDDVLRARGWESSVVAVPEAARRRSWVRDLTGQGIEVRFLPAGKSHRQRAVARAISALCDEVGATVVHSHFGTYDMSVTAGVLRVPRVRRPLLIWHYRTALEVPVDQRSFARRIKDWIKYTRNAKHVDACIAVTQALAGEVAQRGMGDRSRAVLAGCDLQTFALDNHTRMRTREELGIPADRVFVLHMGWHWHRKGGDLLAEAGRLLADRGYDNVWFGSIGAPIDDVVAPVHALSATDRIADVHQASDIFVSASRSEGFGNGLVEAMACERVAVAALVDGQRETFAGTGGGCVVVQPESAVALADGIEQLLQSRESWPELGRENRAHVEQRMSMRRWASDMVDVYDELAQVRNVKRPQLRETA